MTETTTLSVRDLSIGIDTGEDKGLAVRGMNLELAPGEIRGLVGESGSGKSLTALAVMGMLPSVARVTAGSIEFHGRDLTALNETELAGVRGREIGIVFQDPLAYLNPRMTIKDQVAEALIAHGASHAAARREAVDLLKLVEIHDAEKRADAYPHEFSGGMRQRVMITMAIANHPSLLIADEPTTALDVTVQAGVLKLLRKIRDEYGMSVLLITHDMGIVGQICDTVSVMYSGRLVEDGPSRTILTAARHPYTRGLIASVPDLDSPVGGRLPAIPGSPPAFGAGSAGCPFAARCSRADEQCRVMPPLVSPEGEPFHEVACWHPVRDGAAASHERRPATGSAVADDPDGETGSPAEGSADDPRGPVLAGTNVSVVFGRGRSEMTAVDRVSIEASEGQTIGVIGESGSGKSTLAKALLGLVPISSGTVTVQGEEWGTGGRAARLEMRRTVQMVFQDPYLSLNPRMRVKDVLAEPLNIFAPASKDKAHRIEELMDIVSLPTSFLRRFPHELSGGQRQRIGIARALAVGPKIIVADEPVSALDVSVQAQVINLFSDLRERTGVGIIFIAHDLGVVRHLCDESLVMHRGKVVERGRTIDLFDRPEHPYTQRLVEGARLGHQAA